MESDAEIWELRRHMKTTTVGRMASTKLFVAGNLDIKFAVDEEKNMLSFRTWKCCLKLPVSWRINSLKKSIFINSSASWLLTVGRVWFLSWDCCSSRVKGRMTEGLNGRCVMQWEFQDDSELSFFVESFEHKEAKKLNIFGRWHATHQSYPAFKNSFQKSPSSFHFSGECASRRVDTAVVVAKVSCQQMEGHRRFGVVKAILEGMTLPVGGGHHFCKRCFCSNLQSRKSSRAHSRGWKFPWNHETCASFACQ